MPKADEYFQSYTDPGVHRRMIQDTVRTEAYEHALKELIRPGMEVIDVGAGSGILSLFAARAGAKKVHAIEASNMAPIIEALAKANGFEDIIQVHHCRAEDFQLDHKVELIVSEWMGYFGLAERMFESVLDVRDRFLTEDGRMVPDRFRLKLFPIQDEGLHQVHGPGSWDEPIYGFDFSPLAEYEYGELTTTAPTILPSGALGPHVSLVDLDLEVCSAEDFFFDEKINLPIECTGQVQGIGGYFEVDLSPENILTCAPEAPATHWRQSWFPVRPFEVLCGDVLELTMQAVPRFDGDIRLPDYLMDGALMRAGKLEHNFFHRHLGSYE
jgi:protein arginine N-methyltransferase 1